MTEKNFVQVKLKVLLGSERKGLVTLLLSREDICKSDALVEKMPQAGLLGMLDVNQMMTQMVQRTQEITMSANPFGIVYRKDVLKLVLSTEEYKKIGSPSIGDIVSIRCFLSSLSLGSNIDRIDE
jgi:hypothetical protein